MTTDGGYFFIFTSVLINEFKTSEFIVYLHQNYASISISNICIKV